MKIEEQKTRIYKDMHGNWRAKTIRTEKGQTFELSTGKNYRGHVTTHATKVEAKAEDGFIVTSFSMNDDFLSIDHGKIRATEKAVKDAHYEFLAAFDLAIEQLPDNALKTDKPEIGDILFLDGYGKTKGSHENKHIIYDITSNKFGTTYHCIEFDSLVIERKSHVKPWSKKFGIGTYYEKGYNMQTLGVDENELSNLLIEAQDLAKVREEADQEKREKAAKEAAEHEKYLSQFTRADVRKTNSLIKKYLREKWGVQQVSTSYDSFSGGDSLDVTYHAPEAIEELESWVNSFQYGHFNGMEDIYEYNKDKDIIIYNHILEQYKYVHVKHVKTEAPEPQPEQAPAEEAENWLSEVVAASVEIIDYSEKAVAVIGDTKPFKDILKKLGGRFNPRLTCGAGWIFPATKRDDLMQFI